MSASDGVVLVVDGDGDVCIGRLTIILNGYIGCIVFVDRIVSVIQLRFLFLINKLVVLAS